MAYMNDILAQRIAKYLNRRGYPLCVADDVTRVAQGGSTSDIELDEAILNEMLEYGIAGELKHSARRDDICTCPRSILVDGHSVACPLYPKGAA